jgi:hypothetical protein
MTYPVSSGRSGRLVYGLPVPDGCDLERLYGPLAATLPVVRDANDYRPVVLSAENLPCPPSTLHTDRLWWRNPGLWCYDEFPIPIVSLCLDKPTARHLGLLILAVLMHPYPQTTEVVSNHPATQIQYLRVRYEHPSPEEHWGLASVPEFFVYVSSLPMRHPWTESPVSEMPTVTLTNQAEITGTFDRMTIDTVVGFGNAEGSAQLAQLFLDAGLQNNEVDEFKLEGEPGFRGVGVASAELAIWLPGSSGYCPSDR